MVETIALRQSAPSYTLSTPAGFKAIATSISLVGTLVRLLVPEKALNSVFGRTVHHSFASFPKTHTQDDFSAVLTTAGTASSQNVSIGGLRVTFPQVEILPNGDILIVATRCQRLSDGRVEMNARVYDPSGLLKREFLLGDGISHVQADAQGKIWVGYFDEGVYGNFGWQRDGGPFGAAGLSCFRDDGKRIWDFKPPDGFDTISDCYALNACSNGVWVYYYTDFPFAYIDANRRIRCWKNEIAGARTFAVGKNSVLLFGGYDTERDACRLLRLGDDQAEQIAKVSLVLPTGVELSKCIVIGREASLHVLSDDVWHQFSIDSVKS
jgi:hypothetical protein